MSLRRWGILILLCLVSLCPRSGKTAPEGSAPGETAQAGITEVVLETAKGDIVLAVHNDWAPLGAAHFLELVNAKFYDGAPWFRVKEGFVAQCGIAADPQLNTEWGEKTIQGEPVKQGNQAWYVAFGMSSLPDGSSDLNSRSTHIYINLADNSALDARGFACFAQVTEGIDVAQKLYRCEYDDQEGLAAEGGLAAFKQMYPDADYITKAYVRTAASAPAPGSASPSTEQPGATAPPEGEMPGETAQAGTTQVVLETTKGNIVLTVHNDWAPIGAAHFLELVNAKFYDGAPWFRVKEGFVAQCGISADPALNKEWGEKTIDDEPVKQGNQAWYVAFGKTGLPNSRSTHIFINLGDNTRWLDAQDFACFAQVTEGIDVVQKLYRCEYDDQEGLAADGGLAAFKQMYPNADYIAKAYVRTAANAPAPGAASPGAGAAPASGGGAAGIVESR